MLLPNWFKKIGWVILIPALVIGLFSFLRLDTAQLADMIERLIAQGRMDATVENISRITSYTIERVLNNITIIGIIAGCTFITCSREKIEDEMIGQIRLNSLLLSLYVNFAIIIVASLAVYDLAFIDVMIYNMFTLPLLFLIIYKVSIRRFKLSTRDEE